MKLHLLFLMLFVSFITLAQEKEQTTKNVSIFERKHEIKLSTIKLLSGGIFESSYEFIQNKNTGFGASLLINLDTKGNDYMEDYSLTPFYRMYFQTNEDFGAKGFFVEGFSSFFGGKQFVENYTSSGLFINETEENFFDISIGLCLGKKWINTSGFIFEVKAGAGRNLLGNSEFEALFKGDVSVGYRF